jgi:hypothetical protein
MVPAALPHAVSTNSSTTIAHRFTLIRHPFSGLRWAHDPGS